VYKGLPTKVEEWVVVEPTQILLRNLPECTERNGIEL
jgi:hypothetical protein